jgi:hypothetical protein
MWKPGACTVQHAWIAMSFYQSGDYVPGILLATAPKVVESLLLSTTFPSPLRSISRLIVFQHPRFRHITAYSACACSIYKVRLIIFGIEQAIENSKYLLLWSLDSREAIGAMYGKSTPKWGLRGNCGCASLLDGKEALNTLMSDGESVPWTSCELDEGLHLWSKLTFYCTQTVPAGRANVFT